MTGRASHAIDDRSEQAKAKRAKGPLDGKEAVSFARSSLTELIFAMMISLRSPARLAENEPLAFYSFNSLTNRPGCVLRTFLTNILTVFKIIKGSYREKNISIKECRKNRLSSAWSVPET